MKGRTIEEKGFMRMIVLSATGVSLIFPFGDDAGEDIWISVVVGAFMAFLLYLMYSRILSLYPGKDLFMILEERFGEGLSKFILLIYLFSSLFSGVSVLKAYGNFITVTSLEDTPIVVPMIFIIFLCVYICKKGFETFWRWSYLFFLFNAPIPTITILMLIPKMDIYNILPVLGRGIGPVIKSALPFYSIGFTESAFYLMFFFKGKTKKSSYSVYLTALFWTVTLIMGVSVACMLVLGPDIYETALFPTHNVASKITFSELVQRVEPFVIVSTVTAGFIRVAIVILFFAKALTKIFGTNDYKTVVTPVGLLFLCVSIISYENIVELWRFSAYHFQYFFPIFLFVIPFMVWLKCERDEKKVKI